MILPTTPLLWVFFAAALIALGAFVRGASSEAGDISKRSALCLLALLLLAGGYLRFSVLNFGFPEYYHPDESTKSRVLRKMAAAQTLDPHYFLHPSLLLYSAKVTSRLLREGGVYATDDARRYVLAGRFVSATAGTFAIGILFLLIQELTLRRKNAGSVLGAALVAFAPLHLVCSRYFKEDALFTTLLLCVTLLSLRALKQRKTALSAGFFSGLCAGAKYTGGVSIVLPLFVLFFQFLEEKPLLSSRKIRSFFLRGLLLGGCALTAFLLTTPYAVLNSKEFLNGVLFEQRHVLGGHGGIAITAWSQLWTYHLSRSLQRGMTLLPLLLALFGAGAALRRRAPEDLLLLFGAACFYAAAEYVKAKPMPQPDRYALPALLFLSIFAVRALDLLPGRKPWLICCGLLVAFFGLNGWRETRQIVPDTRERMAEWVTANLPRNAKLILVGLPYYAPRLTWKGYRMRVLRPENDRNRHTVENLRNSPHEYLLVTSLSYERFFTQPFADPELRGRFEDFDRSFQLVHKEEVPGGSFGFHNPTLKLYKLR